MLSPSRLLVLLSAVVATVLVGAGPASASTAFYSGLGSAGVTRAKASFKYTEDRNPLYDGDWAKDNKTCATDWAGRFTSAKNGKFVDTLAGYSYGRLGPIFFLKYASKAQRKQIDYVLMYDPGNLDDLSLCDKKVDSSGALAKWLNDNPAARLVIMAGALTGQRSHKGIQEVYFPKIRHRVIAAQVLVCNADGVAHGEVLRRWAYMMSQGPPSKCPDNLVGWDPGGISVPQPISPLPTLPDPGTPGSPTGTLAQGPVAPKGYRYAIGLAGFAANSAIEVTCHDSVDPGGFYRFSLTTDGNGNASTASACFSGDGPDHWAIAGGVESNHVAWSAGAAPAPVPAPTPALAPRTWPEQQGSLGANTFTNPYNASGMGPKIPAMTWVDVSCKVYAPQIASANPDGYWYRIATPPWNNAYYAVANTFWNGDIPGHKPYTHNTDFAVPNC